MCVICIDYQKQLITATEVRRNMGEMKIDPEHRAKIEAMLKDDGAE